MRKVVIGLIVILVLGLALTGCDNGTTTETKVKYESVLPEKDYSSLSQLIAEEEGAFFQNANNRSLRFFEDGTFQVFGIGLGSNLLPAATYGAKYKIDGDTIRVYRAADADASPFYTITYVLKQHTLELIEKKNGVGNAPTDADLPLAKYSYGKLPYYQPGKTI